MQVRVRGAPLCQVHAVERPVARFPSKGADDGLHRQMQKRASPGVTLSASFSSSTPSSTKAGKGKIAGVAWNAAVPERRMCFLLQQEVCFDDGMACVQTERLKSLAKKIGRLILQRMVFKRVVDFIQQRNASNT